MKAKLAHMVERNAVGRDVLRGDDHHLRRPAGLKGSKAVEQMNRMILKFREHSIDYLRIQNRNAIVSDAVVALIDERFDLCSEKRHYLCQFRKWLKS